MTTAPLCGISVTWRTRVRSAGRVVGGELDAAQDLADHDAHLGQGEGRTEAAPPAAAERDPDVGVGPLPDEALRAELQRLGVEPRVAHHEEDGRVDEGARRQVELAVALADGDVLVTTCA